jgi:hypothetical protein
MVLGTQLQLLYSTGLEADRILSSQPPPAITVLEQFTAALNSPRPIREEPRRRFPVLHSVRLAPNNETLAALRHCVLVVRFGIGDADGLRQCLSTVLELIGAHELADQILQELPVVEFSLASYQIVAKARKGDRVDPDGVGVVLLEGCRGESGRYVWIQWKDACVVAVGAADGT